MENCGHFQSLMLDHLYELVDEREAQALREHLAGCEACQAAFAKARSQQRLLATAARLEFPQVHFTAPAPLLEPARVDFGAVQALPRRRPAWVPLAIAMSLVIGLGVAAVFGTRTYSGYRHEQARAADAEQAHADALAKAKKLDRDHENRLEDLKGESRDLVKEYQDLPNKEREALQKVADDANKRQLNVSVFGPEVIQPGRKTEYIVQTKDLTGARVATKVEAKLVNQKGEQVYKPVVESTTAKGEFTISFQPDVPLFPKDHLMLQISARREEGAQVPLEAPIEVAGKPVYFTHLATDKPMYQPGEWVHFRSLTLDRGTMKPPSEDLQVAFTVTNSMDQKFDETGPHATSVMTVDGKPVLGPDKNPIRGIGAGEFFIDPNKYAGGEYTLTVSEVNKRFQPQVRKFKVSRYEPPRYKKKLDFGQTSYGAGQQVTATGSAVTADKDVALKEKAVEVAITIDGKWYDLEGKEYTLEKKIQAKTDKDGQLKLSFKLPDNIERGDANLAVNFDGEAIVRAIPLVMKKLNVEFFPEGGDLVAGLSNRVYFQVKSTLDKPADLRGSIVYTDGDEEKVEVADVQTLHDDSEETRGFNLGMGVFTLKPVAGRKYYLKIQEPIGIDSKPALPTVKDSGVVLNIPGGVYADKETIKVILRSSTAGRSLYVGAYCRGRLVDQKPVDLADKTEASVELKTEPGSGGVCRVTVFEKIKTEGDRVNLVPVAERLVYRTPSERLNLMLTHENSASPGDKVSVHVAASDEHNDLTGAVVLLYVIDQRILSMADEKTARSMPTQFFLAPEVRGPEELEYADFLLTENPKLKDKARIALDLLLGTQGWRRFAEQKNADDLRKGNDGKPKADVERLLVLNGASAGDKTIYNLNEKERGKVVSDYEGQEGLMAKTQEKLLENQNQQVEEGDNADKDRDDQAGLAATALSDYRAAIGELESYDHTFTTLRWVVVPILVLVLAVSGITALVIGVVRNISQAVPYFAGAAACFILLVGAVGFFLWQGRGAAQMTTADARKLERQQQDQFPRPTGNTGQVPQAADRWNLGANGAERDWDKEKKPGAIPPAFPGAGGGPGGPGGDDLQKMLGDKGEGKGGGRPFDRVEDEALLKADKGKHAEAMDRGAPRNLAAKDAKGDNGRRMQELPPELVDQLLEQKRMAGGPGRGRGGFGRKMTPEDLRRLQLQANMPALPEPFIVREYSHTAKNRPDGSPREDFAETLCWQPALVVPNGGSQTITFDLCDSVTTFQVVAFGHTLDGRLGAQTTVIQSSLPFEVRPKMPTEVTTSDRIDLPVTVDNKTAVDRKVALKAEATGLKIEGSTSAELEVAGNHDATKIFRMQPSILEGDAQLIVTGDSKPFAVDSILRKLRVVPDGFPVVRSKSDLLEGRSMTEVVLPETWVAGTLHCQVEVFPSTLADLQKGLESLMREPNGCFEQTSTANYPNLLILDYLRESNQVNPQLEQRARDLLNKGYKTLTGFECQPPNTKKQGYEWFGGASPAHEALTAYGLLEFRDMSRVMTVDNEMVDRTRKYLMEQKNGEGGFKRNARALDSFGRAPEDITNAYIVWSITESGQEDDVEKELTALNGKAQSSKDSYFIALVANSLLNRSKTKEGIDLLKKLSDQQKDDGHLDAGSTSITCSGGRDLQIETTALSVLAWLKRTEFQSPVQKAVKWIGMQRAGSGGFGSTQSTILALKALISFAKANKKTAEAGTLSLVVNDQPVATLDFAAGTQGVLSLDVPEPEKNLKPGPNKVRADITGNNSFPHTVSWSYRAVKPVSAESCPLKLTTELDRKTAKEGDVARLVVTIENTGKDDANMPIAIIGLPGGMKLPDGYKQFDALKQPRDDGKLPGLISHWEIRTTSSRELVLYWRGLKAGQKVEVPLQVICDIPGEYRGPASRAYLYYNADDKYWIDPIGIEIKAKE